jgi:hypothetical protein
MSAGAMFAAPASVIAGLDPAIQAESQQTGHGRMDARVKPGHDSSEDRVQGRGTFAALQEIFAAALLDAERPLPASLTAHTPRPPEKRFAVYRNNVVAGLVNALAARFPATQRIVGEEFFRAMGRLYVSAHPPRSPLLMLYGDGLAEFIAAFEPARELSYLADVARLEAARTCAYHAADAAPLDPARLGAIAPEALAEMRVTLHPALHIVRSDFPVVTIWSMNAGARELAPLDDWRGEDALVTRPALDVQVRALPPGGATFLVALRDGVALAAAADAALAENAAFDLTVNLAGLIEAGAIADVSADTYEGNGNGARS